MVKDELQWNFIKAMKAKIPQRGRLAGILTELLLIEKEAVYRRLRGEVPFSLNDVVIISRELNISADEIFCNSSDKSRPFKMKMTEFCGMEESDYANIEQFLKDIEPLKSKAETEIGVAYNMIPQTLHLPYHNIYRFYLFKWTFHNCNPENTKTFADVVPSQRLVKLNEKIVKTARETSNTCYIWDDKIFRNLVNDINYFTGIRLVSPEEVAVLKDEIMVFIDDIEHIAARGSFDNGNKVQFYVSSVSFESSSSYIEMPSTVRTLMKSFTLNDVISSDEVVFRKTKAWINSLKRTSSMISESGEIQRMRFFDQQREIVSKL
ncbi:MAG: hypothetical protein LUF90_09990 [Rikenellaceae bacterium]|nr:hypothetical protein [Rikenellaceae bacterium]